MKIRTIFILTFSSIVCAPTLAFFSQFNNIVSIDGDPIDIELYKAYVTSTAIQRNGLEREFVLEVPDQIYEWYDEAIYEPLRQSCDYQNTKINQPVSQFQPTMSKLDQKLCVDTLFSKIDSALMSSDLKTQSGQTEFTDELMSLAFECGFDTIYLFPKFAVLYVSVTRTEFELLLPQSSCGTKMSDARKEVFLESDGRLNATEVVYLYKILRKKREAQLYFRSFRDWHNRLVDININDLETFVAKREGKKFARKLEVSASFVKERMDYFRNIEIDLMEQNYGRPIRTRP